jgi:hypothetical protein
MAQGKSVRTRTNTGRKVLKGMSPTGRPVGTVDGTPEYTLDCEFYIPKIGELVDWENLTGAVLTISPRDLLGKTEIYLGVFTTEVGAQYNENDEAVRSVTLGALDKKEIGL